MGDMQIVAFGLNNELCGVDTSDVQEIIKYRDVVKVENMPEFIDGVIDYRGVMVPVINLNKRFEFGDTQVTKKTKLIIVKANEILLGFIVNDVMEIIKLTEQDFEPAPDIVRLEGNVYLKCVAKVRDELVSVIDPALVLKDEELKKLEALENTTD